MKKAKLVEIARSKRQRANIQNGKDELIGKILAGIKDENERGSRDTNNTNDDDPNNNQNNSTTNSIELTPLAAILQFSFLRPEKKMSERRAAKIGQKNESKFLRQFWELHTTSKLNVPDGIAPMPINVIYRPGLVCRKGDSNTFVKDSADGVVVVTNSVSGSLYCGKLCCVTCLTIFFAYYGIVTRYT